MKFLKKLVLGSILTVSFLALNGTGLAQDDQTIDKVAGKMDYEFQQMTEQDALGDISTLRQFIVDSLRLLYDEKYQQELDSLESTCVTKIEDLRAERDRLAKMNNALQDSLTQKAARKPLPETATKGYDPQMEARFFNYEKMLKMDTPRRKTSFLKIATTVENIVPFQIEELNNYYEQYFPGARTDSVLDFIVQLNIRENDWGSAERNILKFLYLFPESPLYEEIKTVRSLIFQNEKYYKSYSNILGELVNNIPQLPREDMRYFRYVEILKDLPDLSVRSAFVPEARRFLALYPDSKYAPDACLWIAKSFLNNNQPHSAFLFYQKIMILYPESFHYIGALHASGVIQQEQFSEPANAVATFSELIKRFPEDSLAENAQYRIAKITDENLNDWEKAAYEYQTYADKHQQSPNAIPSLMRKAALQSEKMNMIEEAVRTYKSIDERYPNSNGAQEALAAAAQLYYDKTRYEQSIEIYMSIFQKYPQSEKATAALEKVGEIYQTKLKDNQKAIEILNMIITNYPDTKASAKATKTLQKLEKVK